MKSKSITLLSGGLDSTVSATIAKKKTRLLFGLTFDYGHRAAAMEIKASRNVCKALNIKHIVVKLSFFRDFTKLVMLESKKKIPIIKYSKLEDVWIPNRNGLFINIAACYCEYYGAHFIITGFNREEAQEFPDNTQQFINTINKTLQYSTLKKIKVKSYVAQYTKKEIYSLGQRYNAPLQFIYSCYLGGRKMCGKCVSCRRLRDSGWHHGL